MGSYVRHDCVYIQVVQYDSRCVDFYISKNTDFIPSGRLSTIIKLLQFSSSLNADHLDTKGTMKPGDEEGSPVEVTRARV
jgi:hypothetical protein